MVFLEDECDGTVEKEVGVEQSVGDEFDSGKQEDFEIIALGV